MNIVEIIINNKLAIFKLLETVIPSVLPTITTIVVVFMTYQYNLKQQSKQQKINNQTFIFQNRLTEYRDLYNSMRPLKTLLKNNPEQSKKHIILAYERMDSWEKDTSGYMLLSENSHTAYWNLKNHLKKLKSSKQISWEKDIDKFLKSGTKNQLTLDAELKRALQIDINPLN